MGIMVQMKIGKVSYWQEFNKHQNELIAQGIIETNNRIKARMKGLVGNDVDNTKDENGYIIGSNNMFTTISIFKAYSFNSCIIRFTSSTSINNFTRFYS